MPRRPILVTHRVHAPSAGRSGRRGPSGPARGAVGASRAGRGARRRRPAARCRSPAVRRRCCTVSRGRTRDRAASRPLPRRRDRGGGASGLRPKPGWPRPAAVGRPVVRCGDHEWDAIMCVTITMHWHVARSEFQAATESESLLSASTVNCAACGVTVKCAGRLRRRADQYEGVVLADIFYLSCHHRAERKHRGREAAGLCGRS